VTGPAAVRAFVLTFNQALTEPEPILKSRFPTGTIAGSEI
jgi:hypothetical protein